MSDETTSVESCIFKLQDYCEKAVDRLSLAAAVESRPMMRGILVREAGYYLKSIPKLYEDLLGEITSE